MISLRYSMLKDWRSLCQLAFKARWFGTTEEKQLMSLDHVQAIRWGVYFEQLVWGTGMGGKTIELDPKEKSSVYYERVKKQAKEARRILISEQSFTQLDTQVQLKGILDVEGVKIPIEGNIDAMFWNGNKPFLNVDTKSTADAENEYGDYAWGRPEKMDMSQMVMYRDLVFLNFNVLPRSQYYVADLTKEEKVELIEPEFTDEYIWNHRWNVRIAYQEINQALNFDYWVPKNGYNECKNCPLKSVCPKAVTTPEIKYIQK